MSSNALLDVSLLAWKRKLALLRYWVLRRVGSLRALFRPASECIYVWPPFDDGERTELEQLRLKLVHYLKNVDIEVFYFQRNQDSLLRCQYSPRKSNVLDRRVTADAVASREMARARYCLLWRHEGRPRGGSLTPERYYVSESPLCAGVTDWHRLVSDIYFSRYPLPQRTVRFPESPVDSCAVLGTGPSLDHFFSESNHFGAWIGANGLGFDERIQRIRNPFAFCIIDPYYFIPSPSVQALWQNVFELIRTTPAVFVTTLDFAGYIELNFPQDITQKCFYVRTLGRNTWRTKTNFSLRRLTVTPYGNVLTDVMLPLATSISRHLVLYGCDGVPPGASTFPKAGTVQKCEDVQTQECDAVHNEVQYRAYLDTFSAYTKFVVEECKNQGVDIELRCPSWNPGLSDLPVVPAT